MPTIASSSAWSIRTNSNYDNQKIAKQTLSQESNRSVIPQKNDLTQHVKSRMRNQGSDVIDNQMQAYQILGKQTVIAKRSAQMELRISSPKETLNEQNQDAFQAALGRYKLVEEKLRDSDEAIKISKQALQRALNKYDTAFGIYESAYYRAAEEEHGPDSGMEPNFSRIEAEAEAESAARLAYEAQWKAHYSTEKQFEEFRQLAKKAYQDVGEYFFTIAKSEHNALRSTPQWSDISGGEYAPTTADRYATTFGGEVTQTVNRSNTDTSKPPLMHRVYKGLTEPVGNVISRADQLLAKLGSSELVMDEEFDSVFADLIAQRRVLPAREDIHANWDHYALAHRMGRLAMVGVRLEYRLSSEQLASAFDAMTNNPVGESAVLPGATKKPGYSAVAIHGLESTTKTLSPSFPQTQLDKKFKHAGDFDVYSTKKNPETLGQYQKALEAHLKDPATQSYGTYQYSPNSTVHYNSRTKNVVILKADGEFLTGWKLSTNSVQFKNYLTSGVLR
jgi:filamentous hemagglutinin